MSRGLIPPKPHGVTELRLRRLLPIGDGLVDGAAHDAGIGNFGVAKFAGVMRPLQRQEIMVQIELNRPSRCQFFGRHLPKARRDKAVGLLFPNPYATSRQTIAKCSVHYRAAQSYRQSGLAAPSK